MMTNDEIARIINPTFRSVYFPTTEPTKLIFADGSVKVGYFEFTNDSNNLEKENKYTFIEYGENSQMFRATGDLKYVTTIDANILKSVEYPSYSSRLLNQLKNINKIVKNGQNRKWLEFKESWTNSVKELINTIIYKWLDEYEKSGYMRFSILPVKRYEATLGEYLTTVLEIQINNGKIISVDPISSISSEYDGRLDFYMLGNINNKVSILRKIVSDGGCIWLLAKSSDPKTHFVLNQQLFIKQISEWLQ